MAFVSGKNNGVSITCTGGAATTLRIIDWDWNEKVEALMTTHSLSNGITDRIAGLLDGEGNVNANIWDLTLPASFGLYAGNTAVITKTLVSALTKVFSIPVLIVSVPYKSSVAGLATYSFNVALASGVGTYTRPS